MTTPQKEQPKPQHPHAQGAERIIRGVIYVPLGILFVLIALYVAPIAWLVAAWFIIFVLLPLFLPDWLATLLLEFSKVAFIIMALLILGYWFFEYQTSGGLKSLGVLAENIAVQERFQTFWNTIKVYVTNPALIGTEYAGGWGGTGTVNEQDIKKGVLFGKIDTRRTSNLFTQGEDIRIEVPVTIDPLEQGNTKITFACEIEKELPDPTDPTSTKKEWVRGNIEFFSGLQGNTVTVYEGRQERLLFDCVFPKELNINIVKPQKTKINLNQLDFPLVSDYIDQLEELDKEAHEVDAQTFTYRILATYEDFTTISTIKIYNLLNEHKQQLREPYTERPVSSCIQGCGLTRLTLTTGSEMPQTEAGKHRLTLTLNSQLDYYGNIEELKHLTVTLPSTFALQSCQHFGNDNTLDSADPYTSYMNTQLKNTQETPFTSIFACDYSIPQPRERKGYDDIIAEALYDYTVQKSGTLKIIDVKDLTTPPTEEATS